MMQIGGRIPMHVTLIFTEALSSSVGRKHLEIRVEGPVVMRDLFKMAGNQEGNPTLFSELEGFMISCDGILLEHSEALKRSVHPGQEILLLPAMEGG